jgi:aminoglycoside 6'-N-acetyltransferase I
MIRIARAGAADFADWLKLRNALWPHAEPENPEEMRAILGDDNLVAFVARDESGAAVGFAEAAIRRDHVNGCNSSPVGFLEGIYVAKSARRHGVARQLVAAVADWSRGEGCSELASDAAIDNDASHRMHEALGFSETQRVVYFRRVL